MSFWAYMLRCADGTYYTGHTDDLDKRVWQHQTGAMRGYTSQRRPVELVWSDYFSSRADAQEAEHRIKGWSRAKKEAFVAENWDRLKRMAQPPGERTDRSVAQSQPRLSERSRGPLSSEVENPIIAASASLGKGPRLRSDRRENSAIVPSSSPPPLIILVRPQLGENIGKAARAMLNFGLTEMRLVSPRDGWPNPSAGPAAAGADIVLAQARVFESVADATADCAHVYATTVRKRGVTKPVFTPEEAVRAIRATAERSAILFGPERAGLESDDVALARAIITVPINPEFSSLNLAQAVILTAYEWSKGEALASPPKVDLEPPAPQEELEGLIGQLDTMLEDAHYFWPPDRTQITKRTLRNLLTKPAWNAGEVRTLRGILRAIGPENPHAKRG